jgi:hypothetical protein
MEASKKTLLAIGDLLKNYPSNSIQIFELNPLELDQTNKSLESIVAFVNPKSGGQKGKIVYERLKNYLNSKNVFDLTKESPRTGLEKHKNKKDLKILGKFKE